MIRFFSKNGVVYQCDDSNYTQDEKDALIGEAQVALDAIEEGEDTTEAQAALDAANAIIACAPAGAVELTGQDLEDALNPPKTYAEELAELNADKRAKEKDFAEKFALILGRNGPTQDPATIAIRDNLLAKIDSDYLAAKSALNLKYYGE